MATWTTIPDSELAVDAPARSINALQLRDNPTAIAEGAGGAPRIEDAALDSTATIDGRNWVLDRMALVTLSQTGSYAFLHNNGASANAGNTIAGASLVYASTGANSATSPPGTWRAMGNAPNGAATLFLRIS